MKKKKTPAIFYFSITHSLGAIFVLCPLCSSFYFLPFPPTFLLFTVPRIQGFESSAPTVRKRRDKSSHQTQVVLKKNNLHPPCENHTEHGCSLKMSSRD